MDTPTEINSVYWDSKKKSWKYEMLHERLWCAAVQKRWGPRFEAYRQKNKTGV